MNQKRKEQMKKNPINQGTVSLKPTTNKKLVQQIQFNLSLLKDKQWVISDQQYKYQNWKEVFQHIFKCQAEHLYLFNNKHPSIIKQIENVDYTALKHLWLYENKINNIQSLANIEFRSLETLDLSNNRISQIKCFNKISSLIMWLYLQNNPLTEVNSLTRLKIDKDQIYHVYLERQRESSQQTICIDLSLIVKLNSRLINIVKIIKADKRIRQKKVQSRIKRRFPQIKLNSQNLINNHQWFGN